MHYLRKVRIELILMSEYGPKLLTVSSVLDKLSRWKKHAIEAIGYLLSAIYL
jgi:hypothetical protein